MDSLIIHILKKGKKKKPTQNTVHVWASVAECVQHLWTDSLAWLNSLTSERVLLYPESCELLHTVATCSDPNRGARLKEYVPDEIIPVFDAKLCIYCAGGEDFETLKKNICISFSPPPFFSVSLSPSFNAAV